LQRRTLAQSKSLDLRHRLHARIHFSRARKRFGHRRSARSMSKENGTVAPIGWDSLSFLRAPHLSGFQIDKLNPRAGQTRD
jgi:hypothetical protein